MFQCFAARASCAEERKEKNITENLKMNIKNKSNTNLLLYFEVINK